jgi:CubicO group peptidase (beta-lactamase class C family)
MPNFEPVLEAFDAFHHADPTYGAQLAVHVAGERVVDACHGMAPDALLPVFSSSKGASAVVIALLVERGQLELDATVASYWPEFAQRGKGAVTVRQLLSHQAGLNGVDGGFTAEELLAHDPLAERLAAQRPLWRPGARVEYHAVTIGTMADELVRRTDGRPLAEVLRDDVAAPRGIDVWMGTPESEDHRVLDCQPPTDGEFAAFLADPPAGLDLAGGTGSVSSASLPAGGILDLFVRVNGEEFRRVGPPAAGMLATARGLAALYAALHHEVAGQPRLVGDETIAAMSQIQVSGPELGSGLQVRFGVLFQLPFSPRWPFGSYRAFGHDGAGGSLAFCDPVGDVAFGYTVRRLPLPGGMDPRAVELSRLVRAAVGTH